MNFKIFPLLFSLIFVCDLAYSQKCATDEILEEYFEANPGEKEKFYNQQLSIAQGKAAKGTFNNKSAKYTIPLVVHVIHYNGDGNISKEQIEDGIRVLNEDFQKLNADTSDTRSIFKPIAADSEIEFKLARIAPDSSCTNGIVRINSFLTYDNRNEVKSLSYWDSENYMNVWLVNRIRGSDPTSTTLGYAQFPFSTPLSTYGLVVRNDEWGSIGTAASSDGRTATHEVGHCLNLLHTFQPSVGFPNGCGNRCESSSDFICDTPPASDQGFRCDTTDNTCSNDSRGGATNNSNPYSTDVEDQNENYMGYNSCQTLFTEGQKDRMHDALTRYSHLINLVKASNLRATGTNAGYVASLCPPVADIEITEKLICPGDSITFEDNSYGDTVTTYNWSFEGGSPSTSSDSNPTIAFNSSGVYDITLRVSNSAGADTLVVSDIIIVKDSAAPLSAFNYNEGFENANVIGTGAEWHAISLSRDIKWERSDAASFAGSNSAFLNNYDNQVGETDYLISPVFDMTAVTNPTVKFRVAYKTISGDENDRLLSQTSIDCGKTWRLNNFYRRRDITSGDITSRYTSVASGDWKDLEISLSAAEVNSENAMFRISFQSDGGNNIYLDDFRILGNAATTGLSSVREIEDYFSVHPNPTSGTNTAVEFSLSKASNRTELYITNILGKRITTVYNGSLQADNYEFFVETTGLSAGIYFVTLETDGKRLTKKLIVNNN